MSFQLLSNSGVNVLEEKTYQASGRSSGSACVVQEAPHLPFHLRACCESAEVGEGRFDSARQDP